MQKCDKINRYKWHFQHFLDKGDNMEKSKVYFTELCEGDGRSCKRMRRQAFFDGL